jgi:hypothetical protein
LTYQAVAQRDGYPKNELINQLVRLSGGLNGCKFLEVPHNSWA